MKTTEIPIDDELLALLDGEGVDAGRALHEAAVLELYRRGSISAGRAAALLNMEKWTFVRWAGDCCIERGGNALGVRWQRTAGIRRLRHRTSSECAGDDRR